MKRTLDQLRSARKGRIYLYLRDGDAIRQFTADAEAEGYRFGTVRPSESPADDLIALGEGRQLSHVGAVGRMAFQCGGGSGAKGAFHRIDYARYRRGDKTYDFVPLRPLPVDPETKK